MRRLEEFVRHIRPAPVASVVAHALGLNKRRIVHTEYGSFLVNAVSSFGSALTLEGLYEPQMQAAMCQCLNPGAVFVDLGANEGYFTVLGSRMVGPRGTVIAVEPQSRLQSVIQANLSMNACYNVRLVNAVVSSKTEHVRINLTPDMNTGATSLFRQTTYALPSEKVQSFTLAEFLNRTGIDHCDLMKVDIEGAEYDVFTAAGTILRKGIVKNIALEMHHSILESRGLSAIQVHNQLLACGYSLITQDSSSIYRFVGT